MENGKARSWQQRSYKGCVMKSNKNDDPSRDRICQRAKNSEKMKNEKGLWLTDKLVSLTLFIMTTYYVQLTADDSR